MMESDSSDEKSATSAAIYARRRFDAIAAAFICMDGDRVVCERRKTAKRKDWKVHISKEMPVLFRKMYRMT